MRISWQRFWLQELCRSVSRHFLDTAFQQVRRCVWKGASLSTLASRFEWYISMTGYVIVGKYQAGVMWCGPMWSREVWFILDGWRCVHLQKQLQHKWHCSHHLMYIWRIKCDIKSTFTIQHVRAKISLFPCWTLKSLVISCTVILNRLTSFVSL